MTEESILFSSTESITLFLLIFALGIFGWLSARSGNLRSFQFQISLFILIWLIGELVDFLQEEGVIQLFVEEMSMYIHVLAMIVFSAMLWARFYLSKRSGKKMADELEEEI
jgi:hypothetical protein